MFNFISWKGEKLVRTVLVTGGTRGIGASIAIAFKDAGYSVAANYASNDEEARKFEEENGIPVFKFDAGNYQGSCDAVEEVKAAADLGETTDPYRPIIVKFIEPIKPGLDREKFEEKLEIAIEGETKTLTDRSN